MVIIKVYYTGFGNSHYCVKTEMYNRKYISEKEVKEMWDEHIKSGHYHDYYIRLISV